MAKERKLTLRMDDELYTWFGVYCKSRNLAMSKVVREYLENLRRLDTGKLRKGREGDK
jgi:hypothetical protein